VVIVGLLIAYFMKKGKANENTNKLPEEKKTVDGHKVLKDDSAINLDASSISASSPDPLNKGDKSPVDTNDVHISV
jgi:hypothetical protein